MTKQTAALHGRMDWKAAILAGLIGGVVFLMIEMILLVTGESPEAPLRMMAAMVTGDGVRPPPATFDTVVVPVILSILLAVVFASVLWRWRLGSGAAGLSACWYISSTSIRWPQFCNSVCVVCDGAALDLDYQPRRPRCRLGSGVPHTCPQRTTRGTSSRMTEPVKKAEV